MVLAVGWQTGSTWPTETVVALNSVYMRSTSLVNGDVGVITAGTTWLNGTNELAMDANAEVTGKVRADTINMLSSAHVFGTAQYNQLTGFGTINGTKTTPLPLNVNITVVAAANFVAGTTPIACAAGTTTSKGSGSYGAITLASGTAASPTVLYLNAGTYNVDSIVMGDFARIMCKGACQIDVKNRVSVGNHSYIGPGTTATNTNLTMDMVKLFVEGTNAVQTPTGTPAAMSIGTRSELKAFTFVPNGTLVLGTSSNGVGKFIAKDVDIGSDVELMTGSSSQRVFYAPYFYAAGPTWPNEVVTALNSIDYLSGTTLTGDSAVIQDNAGASYLNTTEGSIGSNSTVTGNLRASSISLGTNAKVLGTATYNTKTGTGTATTLVTPLTMPIDIRTPVFPMITSGSSAITLKASVDSTLNAGQYKSFTLNNGTAADHTTLTLNGGLYQVNSISMGNFTDLKCNAACEIRVKTTITTGTTSTFGAASTVDAASAVIYVYGTTGSSPGSTPFAVSFGASNAVKGFVFAPLGTLATGTNSSLTGRFIARDVRLGGSNTSTTNTRAGTTETAPTIQVQPINDIVVAGTASTFSVQATGTNIAFQWTKNGVAIAGATSGSYTITNAQASDAGSYAVIVSNTVGSVTSTAATLSIGSCDPDTYVATVSNCGVGACARTGMLTCPAGSVVDSCVAGTAAASDTTCNGIDDNCNGQTDEGYAPVTTTCGAGACAANGVTSCVAGVVQDSCTTSVPAPNDATCDGRDDDCDGRIDENYAPTTTSCGIGVCAAMGVTSCVAGAIVDSCAPGSPTATSDTTCNGIDEDCSGAADEDYTQQTTSCGVGACKSNGVTDCVAGVVVDSCRAGTNAPSDPTCDGVDDDCDNKIDENYAPIATSCGVGACASTGVTRCVSGTVKNSCVAGTPAANDASCDGIDNNCNGSTDEGYVSVGTNCGTGVCARTGSTSCVAGAVQNSCVAGSPTSTTDTTCDGLDNNCNGSTDEGYVNTTSNCGVGACARTGTISCVSGALQNSCTAGTPAPSDTSCDGVDNNCNGQTDEGYVSVATNCGQGVCARTGSTSCVAGSVQNSCVAGAATGPDTDCNGLDDNCNGSTDEGYTPVPTSCGVGTCASTGVTSCVSGSVQNSCAAGTPAASDTSCDGLDNNCNGQTDESYVSVATSCGQGVCARTGVTSCVSGAVQNSCVAGSPTGGDNDCDGLDNNCNGQTDESYVSVATSCGVGGCARTGVTSCVSGSVQNSCVAGSPAANDISCDGVDNDCNGQTDDGYVSLATSCGSGGCARTGTTSCVSGSVQDSCTVPSSDLDSDGTLDCNDSCPNDPAKITPGTCGCGVSEVDSDGDGLKNCQDNCPNASNPSQTDSDGDLIGDACDAPLMLAMAAGSAHTCAVLQDHQVGCWGSNTSGQLGNGTTTAALKPVIVSSLTDATDVATGAGHSCALRSTGAVACWGSNASGQLGNNTTTASLVPVAVSGITDAVQVSAGHDYSCALRATGAVVCWGINDVGQLGNGTKVASKVPVTVSNLANAVQIATGFNHTCALRSTGVISCWGANTYGQLGNGTKVASTTPVNVSGLSNMTQVATGDLHSCAIASNGTLACWGANWYGQLGDGSLVDSTTPVPVLNVSDATQIEAGELHSCALRSTHGVVCWGYNSYGELGNDSFADSSVPVAVSGLSDATEIQLGDLHSCALRSNGAARCWGDDEDGQLGNNVGPLVTAPSLVATMTNAHKVSAGMSHTCAMRAAGEVDCWGINADGQLGNGLGYDSPSPVVVSGISNALDVAAGSDHTCAVLSSGQVKCWGYGDYGQLGDGNGSSAVTPVVVSGIANATGVAAGDLHSCALLSTGQVKCWGSGTFGELGNGAGADSLTPVVVSGINDAVAIAAGGSHSCAVRSSGQVVCWGYGTAGQLGNGASTTQLSPVTVSNISTAVAIDVGSFHSCALLSTGDVRCWGQNSYGQLGNGTHTGSNVPVTATSVTGAVSVLAGADHSCAVLASGGMSCWGNNSQGQLGNGTTVSAASFVSVSSMPDAIGGGIGYYDTCAVRSTGELRCWGDASRGKLGNRYPWASGPVDVTFF